MHAKGGWSLKTDYIRVTGQTDATRLATWLAEQRPDLFAWEAGRPSRRYASSLISEGGVMLQYGRRNADGLDCPQSDTRDSDDFCLEVPGDASSPVLVMLQGHVDSRAFQCARRDVCATFRPKDPAHVYRVFSDLVLGAFGRPPRFIGPDGAAWEGVSLQTHEKQALGPRFAILYDKHAESPDEYTDAGTLRLEFRFQPEKKEQKRLAFLVSNDQLVDSWRFARNVCEVMTNQPREKSFTWLPPSPDREFMSKVQSLIRSYGPTMALGISRHGRAFLDAVALASVLQAEHPEIAKALPVVEPAELA